MSSRSEKGRKIAWIVTERVREVTTPGLGRWDPAWELVSGPSDCFMDALHQWETTGTPEDLENVHGSAEALVAAWRKADTKFQVSRLADVQVPA